VWDAGPKEIWKLSEILPDPLPGVLFLYSGHGELLDCLDVDDAHACALQARGRVYGRGAVHFSFEPSRNAEFRAARVAAIRNVARRDSKGAPKGE